MVADFRSEQVADIILECMADFIGIRSQILSEGIAWHAGRSFKRIENAEALSTDAKAPRFAASSFSRHVFLSEAMRCKI